MTSMTWQCDGQDERRAESLMGLASQGLRFHHGDVGRRRHRFARAAQSRPTAPAQRDHRADLNKALAIERTTREALQRRIRELESKLATLSGAQARPSTSDDLALLDLKTSLSGPAVGPLDLEPLQLWLAEAELRADAAEGAGGWSGGEVELIPSLVDIPAVRTTARPEGARVAFEAAEARAAHNATQVRRLTEELAEARAEQMKTMARLRELEAKFRYAEERAGLVSDSLQNYLPEPPSTWKQPEAQEDFVADEEPEATEEEQTLDEALAAWGSQETLREKVQTEASDSDDDEISLDDALTSWGKADIEPSSEKQADTREEEDEDLDDVLAAWGEGDLSGVGGQAVEESDDSFSEALDAWAEEDSASEHRAFGQIDESTNDPELDPLTGSAAGFTAQEPAADFSPDTAEEEALEEDTAQPYLDSLAIGEQADEVSAPESNNDALTDALTGWGTEQDEITPEQADSEQDFEAAEATDTAGEETEPEEQLRSQTLDPQEASTSMGELDINSLSDVPLEEISEEQQSVDETETAQEPETIDQTEIFQKSPIVEESASLEASGIAAEADTEAPSFEPAVAEAHSDTENANTQKEPEEPFEAHTWGPAVTEELSDAEEAQFESGLAAATSPVDYTGDLENDQETFQPDIALDDEDRTYENGNSATQVDEQISEEARAAYDGELTPELHLDDEDADQGATHVQRPAESMHPPDEPASLEAETSNDFEIEETFTPASTDFTLEEADEQEDDAEAAAVRDSEAFDAEAAPSEMLDTEPSIDVETVVAARRAGREAVEGHTDPESMRRSLRDWSGLAAARREKAARESAAETEAEEVDAEAAANEGQEERQGALRQKKRTSRDVQGKKKMVDALMRFMGDR